MTVRVLILFCNSISEQRCCKDIVKILEYYMYIYTSNILISLYICALYICAFSVELLLYDVHIYKNIRILDGYIDGYLNIRRVCVCVCARVYIQLRLDRESTYIQSTYIQRY